MRATFSLGMSFFLLLLSLFTLPSAVSADHSSQMLRVGIFPFEPINFMDESGEAQGLYPDLLREIARENDWTLEFVPGSWAEGLDRLQDGSIDLMVSVAYTEERAKLMDYTHESVMELWGQVFIRPNSGVDSISDLQDRRVAIMKKDISGANFIRTAEKFDIDYQLVEKPTHAAVFSAVQNGEVAGGVAPQHYGLRHAKEFDLVPSTIQFSPFSIYLAAKKGHQFNALTAIDRQLILWKENKNSFYYQRLSYWLGTQVDNPVIPLWLRWTIAIIGCTVILLIVVTMVLKSQIRKSTSELKASEDRFRRAIIGAPFPIMLHTDDGEVLAVNNIWTQMTGYSPEEIQTTENWAQLAHGAEGPKIHQHIQTLYSSEQRDNPAEYAILTKNGDQLIWAFSSSTLGRFPNGRMGAITMAMDITERKRMEENLREANSINQSLLKTIPFAIDIVDNRGNILFANGLMEQKIGQGNRGDICWTRNKNNGKPCEHCPLEQPIRVGETGSIECSGVIKGRIYEIFHTGMIYRGQEALMEVFLDVTERNRLAEERRKLEKQMLNAQKLESLGVLAGGIAHDFNNLLMAIMGNTELGKRRLSPESPAIGCLQQIEEATRKAADLANQMLAYSGRGKFMIENLDLNRVIEEMLHMLEVSISKKAVMRLDFSPNLPAIEADSTQLRQIIMNLVINASDAVGERSGVIAVSTGAMDCDRQYLRDVWMDENLPEGLYVYFEVADTGCGMAPDSISRIFDPFYSTKFAGRGLGLAAVLGIVRGHGGTIKVYSELGKGSTFKVLFPASSKKLENDVQKIQHDPIIDGGVVLLVDDEETVRGIGKNMLQELGFEVLTAADGREGLAVFDENRNRINFVLMDLTMPHLDGEETFREMRRLDPNVKVILSSGYNEQEVSQKFVGKGLAGFLKKPYSLSSLYEEIKKVTG